MNRSVATQTSEEFPASSSLPGLAVSSGAGAGVALVGAPAAVSAVGFTSSGIAAGSSAASMMSVLGGGATQAGGLVATLQSIGATSSVFVSGPAIVATGGVGLLAGALGYGAYKSIQYLTKDAELEVSPPGRYRLAGETIKPDYRRNQRHQAVQVSLK